MVRGMSNVDQAIPSGWCWRRWLACLDWQADSIPDPHGKSRKFLYPMQSLMGLSKGEFFLFAVSVSIRYSLSLQYFCFYLEHLKKISLNSKDYPLNLKDYPLNFTGE